MTPISHDLNTNLNGYLAQYTIASWCVCDVVKKIGDE